MQHIHMRRKGLQSTRNEPPDTELDGKCKRFYFSALRWIKVQQMKVELLQHMRTITNQIQKRK